MNEKGIYLHEADEYVGPFSSRRDARRFVTLMEMFGSDADGIEIVELEVPPGTLNRKNSGRKEATPLRTLGAFHNASCVRRGVKPIRPS